MTYPLMPRATAVWLIKNTSLTFSQISNFCGLHILEIQGIADGEVAKGIKGISPITNGQISKKELSQCEQNPNFSLSLSSSTLTLIKEQESTNKKKRYVPIARRQGKPDAIAWILKNVPEMSDSQISKLVSTTKSTINLIRDKKHWNYNNIHPKDPVLLGLCSQTDLTYFTHIAKQKANKKM